MNELLVFRLFAPFASWGEVAVGEVRPSAIRPTRSALLGLLAAALGLDRGNDDAHAALAAGTRLAVRLDQPGVALTDYHTINWRRPRREVVLTRADELRAPRHELSTIQSRRYYRCDSAATVAVAEHGEPRWPLAALAAALERPVFPLYLGRKACPPALPLAPEIVQAASLAEAFRLYDRRRPLPASISRHKPRADSAELSWDADLGVDPGEEATAAQIVERRDEPLSRRRWRFSERREAVAEISMSGPSTSSEEGHDVSESPHPG